MPPWGGLVGPRRAYTPPVHAPRPAPTFSARFDGIDALRGFAIVQMVSYHFCYDCNYFGWIHAALTEAPGWVAWRTAIVSQFLFLAGFSLALRGRGNTSAGAGGFGGSFWRRWAQIAGCAALVSVASAQLFGPRFIWFGVLHFVALAQLLLTPLERAPRGRQQRALLVLGVVVLGLGLVVKIDAFAADAWSWIGFSPVKPHTEDFVPLVPWLGVSLIGMAAGNAWLGWTQPLAKEAAHRSAGAPGRPKAALAAIGRWPLSIYMLHQPVLFAVFYLVGPHRA